MEGSGTARRRTPPLPSIMGRYICPYCSEFLRYDTKLSAYFCLDCDYVSHVRQIAGSTCAYGMGSTRRKLVRLAKPAKTPLTTK